VNDAVIHVDSTIHFTSADGTIQAVARIPESERFYYIMRNIAINSKREVFVLLPRRNSIDILRLNFYKNIPPLVPAAVSPQISISHPIAGETASTPTPSRTASSPSALPPSPIAAPSVTLTPNSTSAILESPSTTPNQTSKTNRVPELAYLTLKGNQTQLYTIRTDTLTPNLLLRKPWLILGLTSSYDAKQIAFWGCPGSFSTDCNQNPDIMTIYWNGGKVRQLTSSKNNDMYPDWSPDGRVVFTSSDPSDSRQIYVIHSDGSNLRALTKPPMRNTEPKWSPDGRWIAYHCTQHFETKICIISPDGTPAGEPIPGTEPVWSPPDSTGEVHLAYYCFEGSTIYLCAVRPDGTQWVKITNERAFDPTWSPDGNWLAYVSGSNVNKVCVTCPGDLDPQRLTDEQEMVSCPAWSPDGSWIAYVAGKDLIMVDSDGGNRTVLASGVVSSFIWRR